MDTDGHRSTQIEIKALICVHPCESVAEIEFFSSLLDCKRAANDLRGPIGGSPGQGSACACSRSATITRLAPPRGGRFAAPSTQLPSASVRASVDVGRRHLLWPHIYAMACKGASLLTLLEIILHRRNERAVGLVCSPVERLGCGRYVIGKFVGQTSFQQHSDARVPERIGHRDESVVASSLQVAQVASLGQDKEFTCNRTLDLVEFAAEAFDKHFVATVH